ncbi:MAG TPA: glycosyltransferase [Pirellulales bacterium]|nr:glycosyltransferase [Pirellulales bacterium]
MLLEKQVPATAPLLRGRDIVCLSHDWTGDPLSRTHVMRLLARHNRVLWVNSLGYRAPTVSKADISRALRKLLAAATPLREPEPNIFVLNPLIIPAHGRPWVRAFNQRFLAFQIRRALGRLRFRRPINWTSNPVAAVVAGKLGEEIVVYHCVDENTAFAGVAASVLGDLERQLIGRADVVFVASEALYNAKRPHNPRTFLVRHGVDFQHFRNALAQETIVPAEIAGLPRPIIGYFGLMTPEWVDTRLLARIAERFANGSLVLLGKVKMDLGSIAKLPNVHILGRQPYETLPAYCKGFDAGIIPFPINDLTLHSNPLKAREYLAAGLPVVSTAIPEVNALDQCRVAHDHDEFLRELELALVDHTSRDERSARLSSESWAGRLAQMDEIIGSLCGGNFAASPSRES